MSPIAVASGSPIIATWTGIVSPTTTDWLGLYAPGTIDDQALIDWIYVSCSQTTGDAAASGSCSFLIPSWVPAGTYEVRLFANASTGQFTRLAESNAFTVGATGGPTLAVSARVRFRPVTR